MTEEINVAAEGNARLRLIAANQSIDALADHDRELDPEPEQQLEAPLRYRAPDLVGVIASRSMLPWVSLRIGDDLTEVVSARAGQVVVLTAASGAGKTSLAVEWAWRHALDTGPALYVSCELDADEVGARIVAQRANRSWRDALSSRVPYDEQQAALDLPRLVVLDDDRATLAVAEEAVERMRAECPGQPILVVVDYLSILPSDDDAREERVRVSRVAERIRRWAKRAGVTVVAVSQTSRAAAGALRKGEIVGADTASTGAESAQIERMAAVTIALGDVRRNEDGTDAVTISVGKFRMGEGDRVLPSEFRGRTGSWRATGPSVPAGQHQSEKDQDATKRRAATAKITIAAVIASSAEPISKLGLAEKLSIRRSVAAEAVEVLLDDPESGVVEVRPSGRRNGRAWPVWTRERAEAAELNIVPRLVKAAQ